MAIPKDITIIQAEYNGAPTYLIVTTDTSGKPIKALKWIKDHSSAVWTNRLEMAWHNPDISVVEKALRDNFDLEFKEKQLNFEENKRKQDLIEKLRSLE